MKPGILTTEFWLVVVVGTLTNLGTIEVPDKYKWVVNLGLVIGYALARAITKFYGEPSIPVIGSAIPPEPVNVQGVEEADQKAAKPTRTTKTKAG